MPNFAKLRAMKATLLHVRRLADMVKLTRAIRYYAKALKKAFTQCVFILT